LKRRPTPFEQGFTLIEILIGTALLGMMMLILTGSLRIGAESWEAGEDRMAKASRLFVVEGFLSRHIASLLPISGINGRGEMEPALVGTETSLSYIAPLPDQLEGGGLYRFNLSVVGDDDNRSLKVLIVPYQSNPQGDKAASEPFDDLAIIDHLKVFKLSYFGTNPGAGNTVGAADQAGTWTNKWQEYQLPTLIRVQIEREGEEPWPTLLIAPKAQMLR